MKMKHVKRQMFFPEKVLFLLVSNSVTIYTAIRILFSPFSM